MAATIKGRANWTGSRDNDGHRTYKVTHHIDAEDGDGPPVIMNTPGLPAIGAPWNFGTLDGWAFCSPIMKVSPLGDPTDNRWTAEQTFSTKPLSRAQATPVEDPLAEPWDVSGGFVTRTREQVEGRDGKPFLTSSHELITGSIVEFDEGEPDLRFKFNVGTLPLATFKDAIHHVNDAPIWGLGPREAKLSDISWTRKVYGIDTYYYTIDYYFTVDSTTFDRRALDEGTKVLMEGGDPANPAHFVQYKDARGENGKVLLDGAGKAIVLENPVFRPVEYYHEFNFLLLGVPPTI